MRSVIIIFCSGIFVFGCGKPGDRPNVVARVGTTAINTRELERSYALQPQWKRGETQEHSYLTQVNALIIQKLYALEAEKLSMERDSLMQAYLTFLKHKEMIKGLYRQEVRDKISIGDSEVRRMYEWSKRRVDFEYVYCRDSSTAASLITRLTGTGVAGISLPSDSSVRTGRKDDVTVGSVAREVEEQIFTARLHDVRGPFKVAHGYMAVKITGGTQEKFLAENDFIQQRQKIEKLLTERKADSISAAYVVSLMQDKDLRLNAPVFWGVADHFFRRVKEAHIDPMKIQNINVTSDELHLLDDDLSSMRDATVATHREGILTVRQLIEALSTMPGSLRPRARTPENLKAAIGMIVRNQYLLKEAERRGLERDPDVLYEYQLQRDETLAESYYERRCGQMQVTPEEVESYKRHSPVSEEQVFFKLNMTALARDAKTDSVLEAELPAIKAAYPITVDTLKIRALCAAPDKVLSEEPMRVFLREVFQ